MIVEKIVAVAIKSMLCSYILGGRFFR